MSANNNTNNILTSNMNGNLTGLQGSIGDLDINVNDARNIFNQNLGNTNPNIEAYEEYNKNLNSNVNPIGSGEIIQEPDQNQNINVDENNENINNNEEVANNEEINANQENGEINENQNNENVNNDENLNNNNKEEDIKENNNV